MTILSTPEQIEGFRVRALRSAVKLEAAGMKRRGPSAASLVKTEFGLPKSMKTADVLVFLNAYIFADLGNLTP